NATADDCKPYTDSYNKFHFYQKCRNSYCCGDCYNRYCCSSYFNLVKNVVFPLKCIIEQYLKVIKKKDYAVIATTHHTIVTSVPGQYPQQPTVPAQSYQGAQPYPPYQPVPVQPGYGTHSMPAAVHQGPQFTPGPLPTYQEASECHVPMPYSQAAFQPGQPPYPLQPPVCSNPTAPPAHSDYMAQPAYNPAFAAPPPKTG
uniref:Shisa N-terminal domain-containing protein n=1 Tax=Oryzias melastigma TaxID=30732 RepID=A0A3B3DW85_ORYME